MSVKSEPGTPRSRSQSPFVNDPEGQVRDVVEEALSNPNSASSSKMSTPPLTAASASRKPSRSAPQLIGHLPIARDEALASFTQMPDNWYQYKSLGRSRELMESMTCECQFVPGDDPDSACGHNSDCINRLTQVECLPDDCRCGDYCRNQRFQNKEYAPIEIVKTEMKGYGLRIEEGIDKDTFIYEYVGDVVNTQSFKKRMRDYAHEGIEHFYFMMLQKDEFIDATKNGGIGRFANHSCNPNCYVAKWTIGKTVRMGIFSKRKIQKYEELTFNYNVDRYGHQAQTCYCGEPNCVGFIGGKTQTDVSSMDDLYLDALGITDEDELMEVRGTKKKKGKKIDDPDFMPQMRSIVEREVPKVVQALRQVQSKKVLYKILTRIKITEDAPALRQIMRLRGFSIMKNILEDYAQDLDIISLSLQCMRTWPLVARNKVEDSQVLGSVEALKESEDAEVKEHAAGLYDHWQTLELAYRIPKRSQIEVEEEKKLREAEESKSYDPWDRNPKRSRFIDADDDGKPIQQQQPRFRRTIGSVGPRFQPRPPPTPRLSSTPHPPPTPSASSTPLPPLSTPRPPSPTIEHKRQSAAVNSLIAAVVEEQAAAEQARLEAADKARLAAAKAEAEALKHSSKTGSSETGKSGSGSRKRDKEKKKSSQSEAEKEANKEKRLQKLVGAIVVKCMSKYASSLEHDLFKKYAKELTEKIAEREKKSSAYKEGKLDSLSDEKTAKIKKYAKEYITNKILRKVGKSGRRPSSTAIKQAPSDGTPNSADLPSNMAELEVDGGADVDMDMDIGQDSDSEAEDKIGVFMKAENDDPDLHPYANGRGKGNDFGISPGDTSMDVDRPFKKEESAESETWRGWR
ncbi:histone methyltransferase set2 [Marasmius crinis-equi]|uniref:Histone-lysine N-methyltransferase, H3 lysine-36 specific n=1 Tax=Marasmius crinis-equi TaxID=585013 RepID=A0ABR3FIQ5_9AGAR